MPIALVTPAPRHLASYEEALERGYCPSTTRPALREEHLAALRAAPEAFLAQQDDPEGKGSPMTLPDGSQVPRIPSIVRWMWDEAFAGSISLRWQRGTADLPPHVLGHIGYSVVPWRQRRGYATRALALILPEAARRGLTQVDITTRPDNLPSQKVIAANGGVLVGEFTKGPEYGGSRELLFRIALARPAAAPSGAVTATG
jgi:predicted acetyltransferase